jgi:hypothetical protein
MGKKRKKRSDVTNLKAIYNRGMQLYLEDDLYVRLIIDYGCNMDSFKGTTVAG